MHTTTAPGTNSKLLYEKAECFQVAGDTIDSAWPDIKPFIQKWVQVSGGKFSPENVLSLIQQNLMYALVIHTDGEIHIVAIVEFVQYPQSKTLRLVGFAGKNPILTLKFMPAVEIWAKANGAEELETFATHKAMRLMERMGLKEEYVFMRKPLYDTH